MKPGEAEAMKGFLLSVLAVLAGAVLAVVLVGIGEMVGHVVYPPPPGLVIDIHDPASMKEVMEKIPMGAKAAVVVAWGFATFAGSWFATWLAAKLSRVSIGHGIAVGIIIMPATLTTLTMIPHPLWMWLSGPLVVLAGTYLGGVLLGGRKRGFKPVPVGDLS